MHFSSDMEVMCKLNLFLDQNLIAFSISFVFMIGHIRCYKVQGITHLIGAHISMYASWVTHPLSILKWMSLQITVFYSA